MKKLLLLSLLSVCTASCTTTTNTQPDAGQMGFTTNGTNQLSYVQFPKGFGGNTTDQYSNHTTKNGSMTLDQYRDHINGNGGGWASPGTVGPLR